MQCTVDNRLRQVYHASAGKKGGTTCSVFFVEYPENICHIVALGKHTSNTSASYEILYQKACWTYGRTVVL